MIKIGPYRITSSNASKRNNQPGSFTIMDDAGNKLARVYSPHSKSFNRAMQYPACAERLEAEKQLRENGLSEDTIKMIMSGE